MPNTMFHPGLSIGAPNAEAPRGRGRVVAAQEFILVQNSTTAVTVSCVIPAGSILDVLADTTVAWNSATSATLTIGLAAAGTDIVSGVSTATAGRVRPTFSAAQLVAMRRPLSTGTETTLFITITPVGATSAGTTRVTIIYDTDG